MLTERPVNIKRCAQATYTHMRVYKFYLYNYAQPNFSNPVCSAAIFSKVDHPSCTIRSLIPQQSIVSKRFFTVATSSHFERDTTTFDNQFAPTTGGGSLCVLRAIWSASLHAAHWLFRMCAASLSSPSQPMLLQLTVSGVSAN